MCGVCASVCLGVRSCVPESKQASASRESDRSLTRLSRLFRLPFLACAKSRLEFSDREKNACTETVNARDWRDSRVQILL